MPEGHDADAFRAGVLRQFIMSLGNGLSRLAGKVFRICYLGDFNDLMSPGTLSGVEMGLSIANIPPQKGNADATMNMLKNVLIKSYHTCFFIQPDDFSRWRMI